MRYQVIAKDQKTERARMETTHGVIETPVFISVETVGAIRGATSTDDLREIGTQVKLPSTYHLHMRTGDKLIEEFGGLYKFVSWNKPILTGSGRFQVFSPTKLRRIKEEDVYSNSRVDGHKIFMGPEESMQIQSDPGSTAAMAFDECPPGHTSDEYIRQSVDRTTRWLARYEEEMARLSGLPDTMNREQLLFGINQGGVVDEIRIQHVKTIREMDLGGYAVGGLAVGESHEEIYHILDMTVPHLPEGRPVYLMGVGTSTSILEAVGREVDFFDCVYPSGNGHYGHVCTNHGKLNLFSQKYELDNKSIGEGYGCPAYRSYSRAYIHHLLRAKEILGMRLCTLHNLCFYNTIMKEIRDVIEEHRYSEYRAARLAGMESFLKANE